MNKQLTSYKNSLTQILGIVKKPPEAKPKLRDYFRPKLKTSTERTKKVQIENRTFSSRAPKHRQSSIRSVHDPFGSFLLVRSKPLTHKKSESQPSPLASYLTDVKADMATRSFLKPRRKILKSTIKLSGW